MTRRATRADRLTELQRLHTIYTDATAMLDVRWDPAAPPTRSPSALDLQTISDRAADLFHRWLGVHPTLVAFAELDTRRPSLRVAEALATHPIQATSRVDTTSTPSPRRPRGGTGEAVARTCGSMVFTKEHPAGRLCRHWRQKGSPWCSVHTQRNRRRRRKHA